jgi:hypothetical protein
MIDVNLLEDNERKVVERFKFNPNFTGPPMEAMLFLLCAGANLTFGLIGPNIDDLFAHHQPRNSKHLLEHMWTDRIQAQVRSILMPGAYF